MTYTNKTIYAEPVKCNPVSCMDKNYELTRGIRAEPIVENVHSQDMRKTIFSMYHIPSQNVVLQILRFRDDKEFPCESITLFGEEDKIGEVEKIILETVTK